MVASSPRDMTIESKFLTTCLRTAARTLSHLYLVLLGGWHSVTT